MIRKNYPFTARFTAELHIRGGDEANSKIVFFLFLNENIRCDPLLELPRQDGSNEGSQCMFLWKNKENYP